MRRIVVLEEATEDIERGHEFYELQEIGIGPYLKTPSCPISRVWCFFMASIPNILDFIACSRRGFLSESTTAKRLYTQRFLQFWIFAGIRFGFTKN